MELIPLKKRFSELTGIDPTITAIAPGRVNLIGEHTDYNEGFVLPAAIDKSVYAIASKRDDNKILLYSIQYNEQYEVSINDIQPRKSHWSNYITGVVDKLLKRNYEIAGFTMLIDGDVPVGAGMSSSAAVECVTVMALDQLYSLHIPTLEKALIAQAAEQIFAGVQCGIMDPYASLFGKKGYVMKLDCRTNTHEYIPFRMKGYKIVLFNTNVKHSLASSGYNDRRQQCEAGVKKIQEHKPKVKSLRDVTLPMLHQYIDDPLILKRCAYVVQENNRLIEGCDDLYKEDVISFGKKMLATHEGLKNEYEVSCAELDWLVDAVKNKEGVAGARMMGGGFGGCTINIIQEDMIEKITQQLTYEYPKAMGRALSTYIAMPAEGASVFNNHHTISSS